MSTVTAIIDGCGSIGALQGYLVSWIADTCGWDTVHFSVVLCLVCIDVDSSSTQGMLLEQTKERHGG